MSKQFRENVEIISSASGQSWLKLVNLPSGTAQTTYNGLLWLDASGNVIKINAATIATVTVWPTAPSAPVSGQQWLDTSLAPSELKVYNGAAWELAGDEVQHYANFAAFPATGDEDVLYVDDAADIVYVWDTTTTAYVNASGTGGGLFSISDGTTTESVGVGNTINFAENTNIADVLSVVVSATDTVTLAAIAGATVGQTMVFNGTKFVYGLASAARYANTWTPTANVETVHTHALSAWEDIQIQVRDATTKEIVDVEIRIISATTFGVTSTTTASLRVIAL